VLWTVWRVVESVAVVESVVCCGECGVMWRVVCCGECGVLWRVWRVVESVVCCGECGVLWRVWYDVEVWCVVESGVL